MVEIRYQPLKEIVVHEVIKYPLPDFVQLKTSGKNPAPLRWVDGIVFSSGAIIPTEQLVKEQLEGTIHWGAVEFAEMEDYKPVLSNPTTGESAPVINNSNNTAVCDFVRWLKKQPQWFAKASLA